MVKSKDGDLLESDLNIDELGEKFSDLKEMVERGLAGNDASLRLDNRLDHNIPAKDVVNREIK